MFGYSVDEAMGQPVTMLMPERFREAHTAGIARFNATGQTSVIGRTVELVGLRKDGAEFPIELTISTGEVRGNRFFTSIVRDVTERKATDEALRQSEERMRLQVQNVRDYAIFMLDTEGNVATWNEGAERIKGYKADEIIGQHFSRFYTSEDIAAGKPELELTVATETGCFEDEGWRLRKDGSRFWANVVVTALRDENGTLRGFGKVTRDITERRNAESRIEELNHDLASRNAELIASNKELEAFTYSIAHDLRAPLRHIHGFAKILAEDYGAAMDAEPREYLADILQDTKRMGHLIDDLLNLARLSRQEAHFEVAGLRTIVDDVLRDIQPDTKERQIDWRIGDLPYVTCDASLMKQVYANLISNAVKYTRPRKPALIEIGAEQQGGETVMFVRDNGVGFNMKYADKLFGVFQRLHRSEDFEGTGVGLATIQRIIHKHAGRIWAEAELDKGAAFYFTLGTSESSDVPPATDKQADALDESSEPVLTGTRGEL
jgi:PAS domain S-box-containing protein